MILRSRDNAQFKHWAKLSSDTRYRKQQNRALIEGPHLVAALLERGSKPVRLLVREGSLKNVEVELLAQKAGIEPIELGKNLFNSIADTETPQGIAAEIEIPRTESLKGDCVFLEGVQDAGNVGAIIRSAAAFGTGTVILDRDCADAWSPKVLRAAAGGHFSLAILESVDLLATLGQFNGKLLCTVPRKGIELAKADLSGTLGWIFGSEGKGVSPAVQHKAVLKITIPTLPGTESLNVAATAAVCLYQGFSATSRISRPAAGS